MLAVVGYATPRLGLIDGFAHATAEPTMSILTPVAQTSLAVELQFLGALVVTLGYGERAIGIRG